MVDPFLLQLKIPIIQEIRKMNKKTQKDFEEDVSWIAQSARGHDVTEFITKWKDKVIFDDDN